MPAGSSSSSSSSYSSSASLVAPIPFSAGPSFGTFDGPSAASGSGLAPVPRLSPGTFAAEIQSWSMGLVFRLLDYLKKTRHESAHAWMCYSTLKLLLRESVKIKIDDRLVQQFTNDAVEMQVYARALASVGLCYSVYFSLVEKMDQWKTQLLARLTGTVSTQQFIDELSQSMLAHFDLSVFVTHASDENIPLRTTFVDVFRTTILRNLVAVRNDLLARSGEVFSESVVEKITQMHTEISTQLRKELTQQQAEICKKITVEHFPDLFGSAQDRVVDADFETRVVDEDSQRASRNRFKQKIESMTGAMKGDMTSSTAASISGTFLQCYQEQLLYLDDVIEAHRKNTARFPSELRLVENDLDESGYISKMTEDQHLKQLATACFHELMFHYFNPQEEPVGLDIFRERWQAIVAELKHAYQQMIAIVDADGSDRPQSQEAIAVYEAYCSALWNRQTPSATGDAFVLPDGEKYWGLLTVVFGELTQWLSARAALFLKFKETLTNAKQLQEHYEAREQGYLTLLLDYGHRPVHGDQEQQAVATRQASNGKTTVFQLTDHPLLTPFQAVNAADSLATLLQLARQHQEEGKVTQENWMLWQAPLLVEQVSIEQLSLLDDLLELANKHFHPRKHRQLKEAYVAWEEKAREAEAAFPEFARVLHKLRMLAGGETEAEGRHPRRTGYFYQSRSWSANGFADFKAAVSELADAFAQAKIAQLRGLLRKAQAEWLWHLSGKRLPDLHPEQVRDAQGVTVLSRILELEDPLALSYLILPLATIPLMGTLEMYPNMTFLPNSEHLPTLVLFNEWAKFRIAHAIQLKDDLANVLPVKISYNRLYELFNAMPSELKKVAQASAFGEAARSLITDLFMCMEEKIQEIEWLLGEELVRPKARPPVLEDDGTEPEEKIHIALYYLPESGNISYTFFHASGEQLSCATISPLEYTVDQRLGNFRRLAEALEGQDAELKQWALGRYKSSLLHLIMTRGDFEASWTAHLQFFHEMREQLEKYHAAKVSSMQTGSDTSLNALLCELKVRIETFLQSEVPGRFGRQLHHCLRILDDLLTRYQTEAEFAYTPANYQVGKIKGEIQHNFMQNMRRAQEATYDCILREKEANQHEKQQLAREGARHKLKALTLKIREINCQIMETPQEEVEKRQSLEQKRTRYENLLATTRKDFQSKGLISVSSERGAARSGIAPRSTHSSVLAEASAPGTDGVAGPSNLEHEHPEYVASAGAAPS